MKETPSMTRKQALDALFDLRDAYLRLLSYEQWQQQAEALTRLRDAFDVFTRLIYGPHDPSRQYSVLCECCRHSSAERLAQEKDKSILVMCCTPCFTALQTKHQLAEEEDV